MLIERRIDAISAMSEAFGFIKSNFWDVLLISLLMVGISLGIGMAFGVVRMVMNFIPIVGPLVDMVVMVPLQYAVNIYIALIVTAAFSVMLLDRTGGLPAPGQAFYPGPAPTHPVQPSGIGTVAGGMAGQTLEPPYAPPVDDHMKDYSVEPAPSELEAEVRDESPDDPEEDFLMAGPIEDDASPLIEPPFCEQMPEPLAPPTPEPFVSPPPFGEAEDAGSRTPLSRPPMPERPPLDRPVRPHAPPVQPEPVKPRPVAPNIPPVIEPEKWPPFEPKKSDEDNNGPGSDDMTKPG
jgi:hypothetical protein